MTPKADLERFREQAREAVRGKTDPGSHVHPDVYSDAASGVWQPEVERLLTALKEARDMVADWSGYADDYFREKWDLEGDLAKLDAAIAGDGDAT